MAAADGETRRLTVVPAGEAGAAGAVVGRLDMYLVGALDLTRARVQALVAAERVSVGGRLATKAGTRLRAGDEIVVVLPPPPAPPDPSTAPDIPFAVLYEDAAVVVLDKPAGVVVHPAPGNRTGTLSDAVVARWPEMAGVGSERRPGVVHRLDKETSGCIAFARTNPAYYALTEALRLRTLRRTYLAAAVGTFDEDEGTITAPVGRSYDDRRRMAVVGSGRPATTRFRVLERFAAATLLEVVLETGRTHQIRVHLAHVGRPVVGDSVYGRKGPAFPRQALHAARLDLVSPATGRAVRVEAPLPADMAGLLEALRRG